MRYGETHAERYQRRKEEEKQERIERGAWRKKYALFSTKMDDGTYVWLENYWTRERFLPSEGWSWPGIWVTDRKQCD